MNNTLSFYQFIYDRHLIWHKRKVLYQPGPWTEDPILSKYKFCNVYRVLDRGSQYVIQKVIQQRVSEEIKFFNILVYRIFNLYRLFDGVIWSGLLDPHTFSFKENEALLDSIKASGRVMFSDAYTITQSVPFPEYGKKGKHIQVLLMLEWVRSNVSMIVDLIKNSKTAEGVLETLQNIPMVGPFLAGQIMLDLGYAGISQFGNNDWLVVGPGAAEGLKIIFEKEKLSPKEQVLLTKKLHAQQPDYFALLEQVANKTWLPIAFHDACHPYLSVMDIQNALCEYRKYCNIKRSLTEEGFRCKHRIYQEKTA